MTEHPIPYYWHEEAVAARRPTVTRLVALPAEDLELLVDAAREVLAQDNMRQLEHRPRKLTEGQHKRLNAARLRAQAKLAGTDRG